MWLPLLEEKPGPPAIGEGNKSFTSRPIISQNKNFEKDFFRIVKTPIPFGCGTQGMKIRLDPRANFPR